MDDSSKIKSETSKKVLALRCCFDKTESETSQIHLVGNNKSTSRYFPSTPVKAARCVLSKSSSPWANEQASKQESWPSTPGHAPLGKAAANQRGQACFERRWRESWAKLVCRRLRAFPQVATSCSARRFCRPGAAPTRWWDGFLSSANLRSRADAPGAAQGRDKGTLHIYIYIYMYIVEFTQARKSNQKA